MANRILIADDHEIVRQGVYHKVKTQYPNAIIDQAGSYGRVLELLSENNYDLLISDLKMEQSNPISGLSKILEKFSGIKILVLSMYKPEIFAVRLIKMGVKGYISKEASMEELIFAIKEVMNDKTYCDRSLIHQLIGQVGSGKDGNPLDVLSDRELEILLMMVNGLSTKEISDKLFIHSSTIGTYRHRIFTKLEMDNMVDLTLFAIQHGLID